MLCTTTFPSAKVNSSVKPSVEHSSATQCSVPASAQLSSALSATVPIADDLSVGDLADTSSHLSPQRDVQAAGITLLERGEAVAQEELFLEDLSYTTQGSLMAEQPRAPSASSLPPIPNLGAAALAQGGGPHHTGNHFKPVSKANSSVLMSRLAASYQGSSHEMNQTSSSTSTCPTVEPSDVQPWVKLPSMIPSQALSPVLFSSQLSSTVPTYRQDAAELYLSTETEACSTEAKEDGDEFPHFTPSHCRHLNQDLFYSSAYKAPRQALHSLGSVAQPPPLALETADPTAINPQLLVAIQKAMEEKLYEDALAFHACCLSEPRADQNQVALLRRNCARLHLLQQNPQEALSLCNQILSADSEDVLALQLEAETRRMLNAPSAVSS